MGVKFAFVAFLGWLGGFYRDHFAAENVQRAEEATLLQTRFPDYQSRTEVLQIAAKSGSGRF